MAVRSGQMVFLTGLFVERGGGTGQPVIVLPQLVYQRTLNRLIRFVDEFKQLNFVGDREMEAQLDRVRQEFLSRTAEDYRDDSTARARLQDALQALALTAREMAQQDSRELVERFGQMGQRRFHLAA